jgi:hypothetical protein
VGSADLQIRGRFRTITNLHVQIVDGHAGLIGPGVAISHLSAPPASTDFPVTMSAGQNTIGGAFEKVGQAWRSLVLAE